MTRNSVKGSIHHQCGSEGTLSKQENPLPSKQWSSVNGTTPVQLLPPSVIEEPLDTGCSEKTQQVSGKLCASPHEHSGLVWVTGVHHVPMGDLLMCLPSLIAPFGLCL